MISTAELPSPLGPLLLAASEHGLCGLYFAQHRHFVRPPGWTRAPRQQWLLQAARELDEYFGGDRQVFDLPLDLRGTAFQRSVWDALRTLRFGETVSYRAIASRIGKAAATRAVGAAIGRNPVSIIVPCHRVLGVSGKLCGYAGGVERKRRLLAHEAGDGAPGEISPRQPMAAES